jgi:hypothetical protein
MNPCNVNTETGFAEITEIAEITPSNGDPGTPTYENLR